MVKLGNGITLMPEIAINNEELGICYIDFNEPAPQREIGLVWRKTSLKISIINKLIGIVKSIKGVD